MTEVLFVSLTGGGRAQIGAALLSRRADGSVRVHSAGSAAVAEIDPNVRTVMEEIEIDLIDAFTKPLTLHNFRNRNWKPAQLAAGIDPFRRIYDLRHTFATFALRAGISTFELSRFMGASLTMIDRHYGHLARDGREHAIRLLDTLNQDPLDHAVDVRGRPVDAGATWVATGCGSAYLSRFRRWLICERLPPVAPALLHKCSMPEPRISDEKWRSVVASVSLRSLIAFLQGRGRICPARLECGPWSGEALTPLPATGARRR
jgi:hypothetical protein